MPITFTFPFPLPLPRSVVLAFCLAPALAAASAAAGPASANDYPTDARVDYVLACMGANGQDRLTMLKCSCSIDAIAEQIPYDDYVAVETIKVMGERPGERGVLFREVGWAKDLMEEFRRAQVAADMACF